MYYFSIIFLWESPQVVETSGHIVSLQILTTTMFCLSPHTRHRPGYLWTWSTPAWAHPKQAESSALHRCYSRDYAQPQLGKPNPGTVLSHWMTQPSVVSYTVDCSLLLATPPLAVRTLHPSGFLPPSLQLLSSWSDPVPWLLMPHIYYGPQITSPDASPELRLFIQCFAWPFSLLTWHT